MACTSGHYESARLLHALHWAHKKNEAQIEKQREEQVLQRVEAEVKTMEAEVKAERAQTAYSNWLREKKLDSLSSPSKCEQRRESRIISPFFTRRSSIPCRTCTFSGKSRTKSGQSTSEPKHPVPISINFHQVQKNLDSIGKPDKMHPYTNYRPRAYTARNRKSLTNSAQSKSRASSTKATNRSSTSKSRANSRATNRCSTAPTAGVNFFANKIRPSAQSRNHDNSGRGIADVETLVSEPPLSAANVTAGSNNFKTSPTVDEENGAFSKSNYAAHGKGNTSDSDEHSNSEDSESEYYELNLSKLNMHDDGDGLTYPQYGFDIDDDASLFHDVGEFNDLESLSLPAVLTKDKTPAEVLQLLQHLGSSGNTKRKFSRSHSFSHNTNQFSGHFRRRLSLGPIPEGRMVTDYTEKEEENDIESQILRDLENSIRSIDGTEDKDGSVESSWLQPPTGVSSDENPSSAYAIQSLQPPASTFAEESLLPQERTVPPPKMLKIVNLAWDVTSNTVQSHVSLSPITPPPTRKSSLMSPHATRLQQHGTTDSPQHELVAPLPVPQFDEAALSPQETTPSHRTTPPPRKITPPASHKISPPSHKISPPPPHNSIPPELTPPSCNITPSQCLTPARKLTPPSRKLTPPPHTVTPPSHYFAPRKFTPPSRKITPPLRSVSPPHEDTLNTENTMPLPSSPIQSSASDSCIVLSRQRRSTPPHITRSPHTPLFYIEEAEDLPTSSNIEVK